MLADRPLRGTRFSLRVELPPTIAWVRVTTVDSADRRSSSLVGPVLGLPQRASPRVVAARLDGALARSVVALARGFPGTSGVYVQDLGTGQGAAWNASARFPAASTLKLAIAVAVLRAHDGVPPAGSRVASLLTSMLVRSDNDAANALEVWLAGSTSAGSARVNETMRALGLHDSEMYGGYERTPQRAAVADPDPGREQPRLRRRQVHDRLGSRAARPRGLPRRGRQGVAAAARRHRVGGAAPALAARARRGRRQARLGSQDPTCASSTRPAGWRRPATTRGIVVWPGGAFVAAVLTWNRAGVGTAGDVLAGRVAAESLKRFR